MTISTTRGGLWGLSPPKHEIAPPKQKIFYTFLNSM